MLIRKLSDKSDDTHTHNAATFARELSADQNTVPIDDGVWILIGRIVERTRSEESDGDFLDVLWCWFSLMDQSCERFLRAGESGDLPGESGF